MALAELHAEVMDADHLALLAAALPHVVRLTMQVVGDGWAPLPHALAALGSLRAYLQVRAAVYPVAGLDAGLGQLAP
jgi:hypothetical protein